MSLLASIAQDWAELVVIGDPTENDRLRATLINEHGTDATHLRILDSTANTWRKTVIEEILRADAVVIRFTPKTSEFPSFDVHAMPVASFLEYYEITPVDPRTGQGLLTELAYCARFNALQKSMVLVDEHLASQVEQFIKIAQIADGDVFLPSGRGMVPQLPRLTALDKQIRQLGEVGAAVAIPDVATLPLHQAMALEQELRRILANLASERAEKESLEDRRTRGYLDIGVSDAPARVFPDYEWKRVRFTPVEELLLLPAGAITEISPTEAAARFGLESTPKCPYCNVTGKPLFLHVDGLELDEGAAVRCKCQRCGRRSTEMVGILLDM